MLKTGSALTVVFLMVLSIFPDSGVLRASSGKTVYSEDSISSFMKHLASTGEYHRAHVELHRLNFYYPGSMDEGELFTSDIYFLYRQGDYKRTIENSAEKRGYPLLCPIGRIFTYDSLLASGALPEFKQMDINFFLSPDSEPLQEYLNLRRFHYLMVSRKITEAKRLSEQYDYPAAYNHLIEYTEKNESLIKNPRIALLMGTIPGMGYIYSGKPGTGITAFIMTALNFGLSALAFSTDNAPIGIATASIGTFFYIGSIAGGYMAAHGWNEEISRRNSLYLSRELDFEGHRYDIMDRYGIPYE